MNIEEMRRKIINKYGYEANETIRFFTLIDICENREDIEKMYTNLISKNISTED